MSTELIIAGHNSTQTLVTFYGKALEGLHLKLQTTEQERAHLETGIRAANAQLVDLQRQLDDATVLLGNATTAAAQAERERDAALRQEDQLRGQLVQLQSEPCPVVNGVPSLLAKPKRVRKTKSTE